MKTLFFLILACTLITGPVFASQLRFEVRARPMSNLIYQLDCMAQVLRCSSKAYEELWSKGLKWNSTDDELLSQWKDVRLKYQGEIKLDEPPEKPLDLPWSGPIGIQLGDKFSIATYHAADRQDLRERLEALVAPTDMEAIDSVISHFEQRFMKWWKASAQQTLTSFRKDLSRKVNQKNVRESIEKFAAFYEAKYPANYTIYLNLFYRPKSSAKGTFATVYENHAVVEVLSGEKVSNVLDIVIHELCHFFHSSSSFEKKRQLTQAFASTQDPLALATYNILNEALATAFGNGIAAELWMESGHFRERMEKARGLYNDVAIDAAAKSLLPILKDDLNHGKTFYAPDFPERAISALQTNIPEIIRAPARLLTELLTVYDSKFKGVLHDKIRRQLRGGFYSKEGLDTESSWEMLKTHPRLNALVLVSPESFKLLRNRSEWVPHKDQDVMRDLFKKKSSFVYAIERFPSSYTFIVAGKSPEELELEFRRLLEAKDRFVGELESQ